MNKSPRILAMPLVAFIAWLLPGSGYFLVGQRLRGITIGGTIILLFVLGLFIGGLKVIDPPASFSKAGEILEKPWFIGQILAGPMTIITASISSGKGATIFDRPIADSHGRIYEIGVLYTAVAGMLNLLAMIDCIDRCSRLEEQA